MTTTYHFPMFARLEPLTPWTGGRLAHTDTISLEEAARFASKHAGTEITPADFLRAAGRGEITMRAIVHQTAKLQRIGGGVYCNAGQPNENTVPSRSILNLPLSACKQLAATGRASWREFDGFKLINGILMRYVIAELTPNEPDFETTPEDCLVTGDAVHALADAYIEAPAQNTATPAPVVIAEAAAVRETRQAIDAPKFSMNKAALVDAHEHEWSTIRRDIAGASTNGLAAAKAGAREWHEATAMEWAKAKGKLKSAAKPTAALAQTMNSMASIPGRMHKLQG